MNPLYTVAAKWLEAYHFIRLLFIGYLNEVLGQSLLFYCHSIGGVGDGHFGQHVSIWSKWEKGTFVFIAVTF